MATFDETAPKLQAKTTGPETSTLDPTPPKVPGAGPIGPHYFRRSRHLIRIQTSAGTLLIEQEIIMTTEAAWAHRKERHDPTWKVVPGSAPMVLASRFIA